MASKKKAPPKHDDAIEALTDKLIADTDRDDDENDDEDPGKSQSVGSNITGPVVSYDDIFKSSSDTSGSLFNSPPKSPFSFDAFKPTGGGDGDIKEKDDNKRDEQQQKEEVKVQPPLPIMSTHLSSEENRKAVVDQKQHREVVRNEWMEQFRKIGQKNQEQITHVGEEGDIVQEGPSEPFEFNLIPMSQAVASTPIHSEEGDGSADPGAKADFEYVPLPSNKIFAANSETGEEFDDDEMVDETGDDFTEESVSSGEAAPDDANILDSHTVTIPLSRMTHEDVSEDPPGEGDVETLEFITDDEADSEGKENVDKLQEGEWLDLEAFEAVGQNAYEGYDVAAEEEEDDDDDSSIEAGPIPELIERVETDDDTSGYDPEQEFNASTSSDESNHKGNEMVEGLDRESVPLTTTLCPPAEASETNDWGYDEHDPDRMEGGLLALSADENLIHDDDVDEIKQNISVRILPPSGGDQSQQNQEDLPVVGAGQTGSEKGSIATGKAAPPEQARSTAVANSSADAAFPSPETKLEDSKTWTPLVILFAIALLAGVIAALVVMSQRDRQSSPSSTVPLFTTVPSAIPTITASPSPAPSSTPTGAPTVSPEPTSAPTFIPTQSPTVSPFPTRGETREPSKSPISSPEPSFLRTTDPTERTTFEPSRLPTAPTTSPIPSPPSGPSLPPTVPVSPTSLPSFTPTLSSEPPENDLCVNAIGPLPTNYTPTVGTIANARVDDVDRCGDVEDTGPGVWYYVIGTGGEMIAHTCLDTSIDSKITIFGSFCDKPVCIEANDNFCGSDTTLSAVSWMSKFRDVYRILVTGNRDYVDGSFTLVIGARYNDECTSAIGPLAVGNPLPIMGDTLEATANEVTCNGETNDSPSVWYLVQGTGGTMTASLCNDTDFAVRIRILTGSCSSLECTAISSTTDCSLTWESAALQEYYVMISGQAADEVGSFSMVLTTTGMQDNDDCPDALGPLSLDGSPVVGSTAAASPDRTAPFCLSATTASSVWYFLEGNGSTLQASLCDFASYDTRLSVYSGDCADNDLSGLICVAGNDDFCGTQSLVTWDSQLGLTYYVLVHGYLESSGSFLLSVTSL